MKGTKLERHQEARMLRLYELRARSWGEQYIVRNWWRIGGMYDIDDIRQDAFAVWLRVFRRHPRKPEPDLFRVFKRGIQGRVDNRARQCFPNSYAYVAEKGKLVVDLDDIESVIRGESGNIENLLVYWADVLTQLPDELSKALKLIIRDFLGSPCIELRKVRRLKGKQRIEPVGTSLSRSLNCDLSRDLLTELEVVVRKLDKHVS